jgi:Spy/CpxP family protein refolding chaperone
MSEMNEREPSHTSPIPPIRASRFGRSGHLARVALLGGVFVGGVALGAGGLAAASAHGGSWMMGGPGWHEGSRLERLQGFSRRILDGIGADSSQQAKIHDIIASTFKEVAPAEGERQALRRQAIELLKAPTVDRAAMERLRADTVAKWDARSKQAVGALADIAETLTPEQRVALAERVERFHDRRGGWRGGWHGRGMRHGMDGERGDDQSGGPDGPRPEQP